MEEFSYNKEAYDKYVEDVSSADEIIFKIKDSLFKDPTKNIYTFKISKSIKKPKHFFVYRLGGESGAYSLTGQTPTTDPVGEIVTHFEQLYPESSKPRSDTRGGYGSGKMDRMQADLAYGHLKENKSQMFKKSELKQIIREEYKKLQLEKNISNIIKEEFSDIMSEARGGDFDPSAPRSRTVYVGRKLTPVSLGFAKDRGIPYRIEKDSDSPLVSPPPPKAQFASGPAEPQPVESEEMKKVKEFKFEYDRADRLDMLPGNFFETRPDRLKILGKAKDFIEGTGKAPSQEEMDNFYK